MYLKRLQMVGFKSFAERVDIHFNKGVTAIVGPNGSGKSNIIDAVRWVLGEQSVRSLRGQRMEDIIFQGSDTRHAMNFAEVTLTLDNTTQTVPLDYAEISVTRRVYRSGESEFFINKQACRLKDIIELFIDSGLGREAFSIISQGKVEEILSSKADDRRVIFEEAAGVLKYKQRKQEAEYKLKETEENLTRVEDIIYEVEQQLDPLKEQASKAEQYNKLNEDLKQIEIRLLVTEISQLHDEWQEKLIKLDETKLKEIKMKTAIQEREAKLTENRHQLQALDERIEALQKDLLEATEQLEKYSGEKNVLAERLKHFEQNKLTLEEEKESVNQTKQALKLAIETEEGQLKSLIEERDQVKANIKVLKDKLLHEQDNIQDTIEQLKADYIELLNERAVTKNEGQTLKRDLEKLRHTHEERDEAHSDVIGRRNSLHREEKSLKNKVTELLGTIKSLEEKKTRSESKRDTLNRSLQSLTEQRYKAQNDLTKLSSRKDTLNEMKESFQGYFYGVRELLTYNKRKKEFHIHGTVFDLIDVDEQYVTAIDTILGAQAQHVVVESEKDARDAIYWLKAQNKGRATFLPLNVIKNRLINEETIKRLKALHGFIGLASELVNVSEQFKAVANHLLGNVLVAETLEAASDMAKLTNRSYRIVTLDGDVVYPGGSMSGGAKRTQNQSLFTREKELQAMAEKITSKQSSIKTLTIEIEQVNEKLKASDVGIDNINVSLDAKEEELAVLKTDLNRISMMIESLNERLQAYDQSVKHEKEEEEALLVRDQALKEKLSSLDVSLAETEGQITKLTERAESLQAEEEEVKANLHKLEISLAERDERVKNERIKLNDLQEQLRHAISESEQLDDKLSALSEIEQSRKLKEKAEQDISKQMSFRDIVQRDLREAQEKRLSLNNVIEDEGKDLKGAQNEHKAVTENIQRQEVQTNRLDVALDTRLLQLEKQYVTTYEKASSQYEKVTNIEQATGEVSELKAFIHRLGTVNLGAIDEYKRMLERHTFLTEQEADLVQAKTTLYAIIEEMDEEMIKRFNTTFTEIQHAFTQVFKELFGGGHAQLTLTDESNLLETGIEIVARPPGKKLRTLDLLSGGERALTAISLLFAILRVRPVPFVILDEVEAALDEVNIVRFAKYVKLYSEETQFIVITHRQGTMEEADVLYGVTMQESGVSRLVSVKLEETEELVTRT